MTSMISTTGLARERANLDFVHLHRSPHVDHVVSIVECQCGGVCWANLWLGIRCHVSLRPSMTETKADS